MDLSMTAHQPKHVVLIVADDLGYADLGYSGSLIATPHLDELAGRGVKLNNFYVQRACSPTRGALLTGRYNIRYGFQSGVLTDHNNYSLPLNETLLPQFIHRTVNASCHALGKWHVGYHRWAHTPTFRGFDSYLGYYGGGEDYYTHQGYCGGFDLHDAPRPMCGANCSRHAWEAVGKYSTHLLTERAVSIVDAHDPRTTLFLYLAYQAVHVPDQVPASYVAPYSFPKVEGTNARNLFAGMLSCLDEGVGNVTHALERRRMLDDTLIWFQTDNGAATPSCGGWTGGQNWPLRVLTLPTLTLVRTLTLPAAERYTACAPSKTSTPHISCHPLTYAGRQVHRVGGRAARGGLPLRGRSPPARARHGRRRRHAHHRRAADAHRRTRRQRLCPRRARLPIRRAQPMGGPLSRRARPTPYRAA